MVRTFPLLALTAGACGLLLSACEVSTPGPPNNGTPAIITPGDSEAIVYSKHIQPIFATSCSGSDCHVNGTNISGMYLDTWEHAMEGTPDYGAEIIPYSPEKSHLFQHINTDTTLAPTALPRMPLGRDPLPRAQLLTIRRWIAEGAKNDAGEVALGDHSRPRVFITAQADDKVTVVDLQAERTARYIDVGTIEGGTPESPHNIVLSPDRQYIYVNLIAAGTIEKYSAHTFEKLGGTRVGLSPAQIAVTSDGSTLYVSNFDNSLQQHFIVRVDAASMIVTDTIFDVGDAPHGVTLSRDEHHLYTTNVLSDNITEVDLSTGEVSRRLDISPNNPHVPGSKPVYEPYQSEVSADGKFLWVTCRAKNEVRVIDLDAWRVVDSIAVNNSPLILKMTPDGRQLWVPNRNSDNISIIDVATRSVVGTIPNLKAQPHAVGFSDDGKTAFVSCENQNGEQHHATAGSARVPGLLYVIDVPSRTIRRQIEIGAFAAGIAVGG
jgi:YVTN family beta-propeller protein